MSSLRDLFLNQKLFEKALIHKSFANEVRSDEHNEKLEFLGDSVLYLVISDFLLEKFTEDTEGALSKKRASLINEESLAELAMKHNISRQLKMGRGEMISGAYHRPRMLASAYEAIVGAMYLDKGFHAVRDFLKIDFEEKIEKISHEIDFQKDYKTRFQVVVQQKRKVTPTYIVIYEEGPSHNRFFKVEVRVNDEVMAIGEGKSKKIAEQHAAQIALEKIEQE